MRSIKYIFKKAFNFYASLIAVPKESLWSSNPLKDSPTPLRQKVFMGVVFFIIFVVIGSVCHFLTTQKPIENQLLSSGVFVDKATTLSGNLQWVMVVMLIFMIFFWLHFQEKKKVWAGWAFFILLPIFVVVGILSLRG